MEDWGPEEVKELRSLLGLSQIQLSRLLGFKSRTNVAHYEQWISEEGARKQRREPTKSIARFLGYLWYIASNDLKYPDSGGVYMDDGDLIVIKVTCTREDLMQLKETMKYYKTDFIGLIRRFCVPLSETIVESIPEDLDEDLDPNLFIDPVPLVVEPNKSTVNQDPNLFCSRYLAFPNGDVRRRLKNDKVSIPLNSLVKSQLKHCNIRVSYNRRTEEYDHGLAIVSSFLGMREDGQVLIHKNGCWTDNRISNLMWGTEEDKVEEPLRHAEKYSKKRGKESAKRIESRVTKLSDDRHGEDSGPNGSRAFAPERYYQMTPEDREKEHQRRIQVRKDIDLAIQDIQKQQYPHLMREDNE